MIDFIFDMDNVLFTTALILTLSAFGLEAVGFIMAGIDIFGMIDSILPDFDTLDPDLDDAPFFHQLLGWAKHKNVPAAIWGVMLTGIFGVLGLILQAYAKDMTGDYLRAIYAVPACLIPTVFITSFITKRLGEHVFVDNTAAVTKESLIGREGYVTIGTGTNSRSVEVSVKDENGRTHLLMCRAEEGEISKGDIVEITQVTGSSAVARLAKN